jgi:5'-nucleotidase
LVTLFTQLLTGGLFMNRRTFIKTLAAGGALWGISKTGIAGSFAKGLTKIAILHTNDTHSQIDPFPATHHRFPGMGGFARRAALVRAIREEEPNVLLFDSGDIYQGTPYFNFYKGELEIKLMSEMRYDGATIGNHEFDNGLDGIERNLQYASFPFISSNYDFKDTILNNKISPYEIFDVADIRIGVFGLGIELEGLVSKSCFGQTLYLDPVEQAAYYAHFLKKEMSCDLIICLSHLGFSYKEDKISDIDIARQSKNIDLILGGHTHTTLEKAVVMSNSDNREVIIGQVGYGGVNLGRMDVYLKKNAGLKFVEGYAINILKKQA